MPPSGEALYEQCLAHLAAECDEEQPDPSAACSEVELATCTDYVTKMNAIEESCEDSWDNVAVKDDPPTSVDTDVAVDNPVSEDSASNDPGEPDVKPDEPTVMDAGVAPDYADETGEAEGTPEATTGEGNGNDDGATISAQEIPNPWQLVECCEQLQLAADPMYDEEVTGITEMFDCILNLADGDCDGALACKEHYRAASNPDNGDVDTVMLDNDEDKSDDEQSGDEDDFAENDTDADAVDVGQDDPTPQGDGDKADQPADSNEPVLGDKADPTPAADNADSVAPKAEADDTKADGGCSFVPLSQGNGLLSILKLVVGDLL